MIDVLWLNFNEEVPSHGYWATGWLEEVFGLGLGDNIDLRNRYHFRNHLSTDSLPSNTGAIVVIPAEYNGEHIDQINAVLSALPWAVVILASDERGLFPVEKLVPVTALWVMTPHFEAHAFPDDTKFMGEFYPPHTRTALRRVEWSDRPYKAGFSGQITHQRREELKQHMISLPETYFNGTGGFTQGLTFESYFQMMVKCVTVPAPSGPVTLDSFRAYEALESGAIPILDLNCPKTQNGTRYWDAVFGIGHPLPTVSHWAELREVMDRFEHPRDTNRIFAWWQQYKRDTLRRILADVPDVSHGEITVLVATSPIAEHPSTEIIEETIASVRHHLPGSEIIVMIDGVRPEQEHYRERYTEYTRRLLWLCNTKLNNVTPMLFTEHNHQANMTRAALDHVLTPTVLFMEHDTPLVTDRPIEWDEIVDLIEAKVVDVMRFHYEGRIHPEHEYLMVDPHVVNLDGVHLRRTKQWSQRPHLASTEYYRAIIREFFPPTSRTMIEDRMHGVVKNNEDRERHRVAVYCPSDPDGHIVRSYHLDGRKADPKFEMVYE